jgi:hypothetical protein
LDLQGKAKVVLDMLKDAEEPTRQRPWRGLYWS